VVYLHLHLLRHLRLSVNLFLEEKAMQEREEIRRERGRVEYRLVEAVEVEVGDRREALVGLLRRQEDIEMTRIEKIQRWRTSPTSSIDLFYFPGLNLAQKLGFIYHRLSSHSQYYLSSG